MGAGEPDQRPWSTVSVAPTERAPETTGGTVTAGAEAVATPTAVVLIAPARAKPDALLAATCAVRYFPASADVET